MLTRFFYLLLCLTLFPPVSFSALSMDTGSFSTNTGTGSQAVTGVGFQPKVIIFTGSATTAEGHVLDSAVHFGAGTSSTARFAFSLFDDNGNTCHETGGRMETDEVIAFVQDAPSASPSELFTADLTSLDSDGFTIEIATATGTALLQPYIALGGTDLTVEVGSFDTNTTTGNQEINLSGAFQPDVVLLVSTIESATEGLTGNGAEAYFNLGAGVSSSSRWSVNIASDPACNADTDNVWSNTNILQKQDDTGILLEMDLVSLDTDGFTVNIGTAFGSAVRVGYIALKGLNVDLGDFAQPTSSGNSSVTGVGFQPSLVMIGSSGTASASDTYNDNYSMSIGASESSSEQHSSNSQMPTGNAVIDASRFFETDEAIVHVDANNDSLFAEANFVTQDSDGFTLNWTTADATARNQVYMALAQSAGGGGGIKKGSVILVS